MKESEVLDDGEEEKPAQHPKASGQKTQAGDEQSKKPSAPSSETAESTDSDSDEKGERPQPRYDSRSFSAWVTRNPEKAADLAAKVFKTQLGENPEGWKKHFIAAENKRRRQSEQLEKAQKALEEEKAGVQKLANDTLSEVQPVLDVIEAAQKGDFPAIDLFVEQTFGISFDDYCRQRLRGSSKETAAERAAKLKAEKLEKELAELKGGKPQDFKAKDEKKGPKVSESWIDSELDAEHGVRDLKDWAAQVEEVYQDSYDDETEEYGLTIEDAADRVLKRFKKKHGLAAEDAPKAAVKKKAKPKKRDADEDEPEERTPAKDLDDETPPTDLQERTRWALARAAKRRA